MSEKRFQASVLELAQICGWHCYHTHDSRRSEPGFPDLVLVRGDRLLFRELKTDKGRMSPAQVQWIIELSGAGADVCVWRPHDWPVIEQQLKQRVMR